GTVGLTDRGEPRDGGACPKSGAFGASRGDLPPLRWHFVGRLQTNKCRSVARYAHVVHSVDRIEVASALADGALRADRQLSVFAQVSLDENPARGGGPAGRVRGACGPKPPPRGVG